MLTPSSWSCWWTSWSRSPWPWPCPCPRPWSIRWARWSNPREGSWWDCCILELGSMRGCVPLEGSICPLGRIWTWRLWSMFNCQWLGSCPSSWKKIIWNPIFSDSKWRTISFYLKNIIMESFNEICPGCALLHQFIMICHYLSFPENIVLINDLFTAKNRQIHFAQSNDKGCAFRDNWMKGTEFLPQTLIFLSRHLYNQM